MTDGQDDSGPYILDTGRSGSLVHVRYEDLMRAIGHYIDEHGLADVLVTQLPDGVLLKGTMIDRSRSGAVERIVSFHFTDEDIVALLQESAKRRGSTDRLRLLPRANE